MSIQFKQFLILTLRVEFLLGVLAFALHLVKAVITHTSLFLMIALIGSVLFSYVLQWKLVNPHKSFLNNIFD